MDEQIADTLAGLEWKAGQRDDLELAWQAASSAVEILFWCDELHRAADLTEKIIYDLGRRGTDLALQILPFASAFVVVDAYTGDSTLPRLKAAAAWMPADSELGKQLVSTAERMLTSTAQDCLPRMRPWEKPRRDPGRADRSMLEQDWETLEGQDVRKLWGAVRRTNDVELALYVAQARQEGPADWATVMWLALWLAYEGKTERASEVLYEGRGCHLPYASWSLLPFNPPLDSLLRRALTPRVRQAYLSEMREPLTEPYS